jgi:uncharacterized protein
VKRIRPLALAAALGAALAAPAAAQSSLNSWYGIANAASHNDMAQVQELLLKGEYDPDAIDSHGGRTALDYAVSFDNTAMAALLLDHGALIDARDRDGNTALHWAAARGKLASMRLLIARKATIDAANRQGITPLIVAVQDMQPAAVRLLLENGADPKKQDFTGRDAFGWAAGKPIVLRALEAKR